MTPVIFPFKEVSITGGTGTVGSQFIKVLLAQLRTSRGSTRLAGTRTALRPGESPSRRASV